MRVADRGLIMLIWILNIIDRVIGLLTEATGGYSAGMAAVAMGPMLTAIIVFSLASSLAPRRPEVALKAEAA